MLDDDPNSSPPTSQALPNPNYLVEWKTNPKMAYFGNTVYV